MATTAEELQEQLEEERENSKRLMEDKEIMKIRNELETKKLKQKQWETAIEQLKQTREHAEQEHARAITEIKEKAEAAKSEVLTTVLDWFKTQVADLSLPNTDTEQEKARKEKNKQIEELMEQQEEIAKKLADLKGEARIDTAKTEATGITQEALLKQLRGILSGKQEEDPNRMLLKAMVMAQNKVPGEGGTHTLKQGIVNSLSPQEGMNDMAEWLASLNKQEEGESELSKFLNTGDGEHKTGKVKSGILDRATTNIQQKQVWPQQNLGEDWADEDIEFKQIKFEHMVAGETRTIETCTGPAHDIRQSTTAQENCIPKTQRI